MVAINNKGSAIYLYEEDLYFDNDSHMFCKLYKFLGYERKCLEQRARVAKITREKNEKKLGRVKGKKVKSIFDPYKTKIKNYHKLGLSKTKIIECNNLNAISAMLILSYL